MSDAQAVLDGACLPAGPIPFGSLRGVFARPRARAAAPTVGPDELEPALAAVLRRLSSDRTLVLQVASVAADGGASARAVAAALAAGAAPVVPDVLLLDAAAGATGAERLVGSTKIRAAPLGPDASLPDARRALLGSLRAERRLLLLADGTVGTAVEAMRAAASDAVLLVVRAGADSHAAVTRTTRLLVEAGAPLFGAVLLGTRALPFGLDRLLGRAAAGSNA